MVTVEPISCLAFIFAKIRVPHDTAQIVSRELTHPKSKQMGSRLSKLSYGLGRSLDLTKISDRQLNVLHA